jgi:hypothetical protein
MQSFPKPIFLRSRRLTKALMRAILQIRTRMPRLFSIVRRVKDVLKRRYHELHVFRRRSPADVFASIWRYNYWLSEESRSGPGSSLAQTETLRNALPQLVADYGIRRMLDAPCGDLNWMRHVLPDLNIDYVGGDIVEDIIRENRARYASHACMFESLDVTVDQLPSADLWMCRALFFHLSNTDIIKAITNYLRSDIPWVLMTNCVTDTSHINTDIHTGGYRILNLLLPPFELPDPVLEIPDCIPPSPPMTMALWHRDALLPVLPRLDASLR